MTKYNFLLSMRTGFRLFGVILVLTSISYCGSQSAPTADAVIQKSSVETPTIVKPTLAVLPCSAIKPIGKDDAIQTRDFLEEEFSKQKRYRLVDRAEIDKIVAEATLAQQGVVDDRQAVKMGGFIGAQYVVTSKLSFTGEKYLVTCRLIEVATATVESSATGRVSALSKLDGAAKGCVRRLLGLM